MYNKTKRFELEIRKTVLNTSSRASIRMVDGRKQVTI